MPRPSHLALPLAALALLVGGCSGAAGSEADEDKPAEGPDLSSVEFEDATGLTDVAVEARDNTFQEQYLEVTAGTAVSFTNVGRTEHNLYPVTDGSFAPVDATDLEPGETATITLADPGDVAFYCTLHGTATKGMAGAIRVVA